jgi:hypothetical protein
MPEEVHFTRNDFPNWIFWKFERYSVQGHPTHVWRLVFDILIVNGENGIFVPQS